MPSLIGIAGGTGAGKTTLVQRLSDRLHDVCIVGLDSYYADRSDLSVESRNCVNYDEPSAIEVALLLNHLRRLARGEPVEKPRYSFEGHTRVGSEPLAPASFILVDGLFTLWWEQLRTVFDLKIFVDSPPDIRLARRIQRDVAERGRTVDSVLAQYFSTVRPMHDRYVEPTRRYADVIVPNTGRIDEWVDLIVSEIRGISTAVGSETRA